MFIIYLINYNINIYKTYLYTGERKYGKGSNHKKPFATTSR